MDITLSWSNYNAGAEDGVRVYRDTSPILDGALPAPLTTLATGANSYVDSTVVRGTQYYYRFGIFKGSDEVLTKNKAIVAVAAADTGPGPQSIAIGDWDLGIFGLTKATDFTTYANLASNLGITTGATMAERDWLKMAYKGKVLFIARNGARSTIPYRDIYLAGAVYGTNDNGLMVPLSTAATNQYRPLTIGGVYTLIPRILKGLPVGATSVPSFASNNSWLAADPGANEWDDITGVLTNFTRWVGDTNYGRFANMREDIGPYLNTTAIGLVDLTQQLAGLSNNTVVTRGGRYSTSSYLPSGINSITASTANLISQTVGGTGGVTLHAVWRPVLELVL